MTGPRWAFWLFTVGTIGMWIGIAANPAQPTWLRVFIVLTMLPVAIHLYLNAYRPHVWSWRNWSPTNRLG